MTLRFAFNTNGATRHRLDDALTLIAEAGYDGVALTLDVHHLDPFDPDFLLTMRHVAARLRALSLGCVVETGAPFLLNPRTRHEPTLVTADPDGRALRLDFLMRALQVAAETGGETMSFSSGAPPPGIDPAAAQAWLLEAAAELAREAESLGVTAALRPSPGMLVATPGQWRALGIPWLRLVLEAGPGAAEAVHAFAGDLGAVVIGDAPGAVLAALQAVAFPNLVCIERPLDSGQADTVIPAALAALRSADPG